MASERILVVDDEPGVRSALQGILGDEGYGVSVAGSGEEGLERLGQERFDAVLLDVWLPGIDGLETLQRIRDKRFDAEVVMISGHGTIETAVRATKLGAFDFVEKPLSLEKTLLVLRNALRQRRLELHNRHLLQQLDLDTEILGRSASAERLRREVEVAAGSDAAALICGEAGSGRERIARRIHAGGRRAGEAFVEVPCGALDPSAAEAVLFGGPGRVSRIDLAAGGSLFLEDVDRLDAALQPRLAAALSREAPRGSVRRIASVRASDELDEGLRQALEVIRISVPPLRERREDVPLLAERFMRDLAREYGKPAKRLSPDSLQAFQGHEWPGNVSELRNLVERLLLFVPGETVQCSDLPEALGGAGPPAEDLYREFASLEEGLQAFERYYLRRMLAAEDSDVAATARRLGLTQAQLRRRMKTVFEPGT